MTGEHSSPGITGETITAADLENIENYTVPPAVDGGQWHLLLLG